MRIVVAVIQRGAHHPDGLRSDLQMPDERPIELLAPVVEIEAPNRKRQRLLDFLGLFERLRAQC